MASFFYITFAPDLKINTYETMAKHTITHRIRAFARRACNALLRNLYLPAWADPRIPSNRLW